MTFMEMGVHDGGMSFFLVEQQCIIKVFDAVNRAKCGMFLLQSP